MRPLTFTRPKVLVPAAGETLLDHVFRRLAVAGVDEALLVTMYLPEQVEAWAEGADRYGIDISITRQSRERYGTGAATLTAKQWVGDEPFLMTFGDVLAGETNFPTLVGMHRKNPDATIVTAYRQELVRGGVVLAEEGRLVALDEHPDQPVPNGLINAGMYLLQPHVFDRLSRVEPSQQKGEYELTDVLGDMGRESDKPLVMEVEDYWVNVSSASDVLAVQSLILEEWRQAADGDGLFVDESAEVSERAVLRAPIRIAAGTRIGAATIGPNVAIGEGAVVGDGAALEDCALLENSHVGTGCHIRYAMLGAGSRVADRARLWGEVDRTSVLADKETHGV